METSVLHTNCYSQKVKFLKSQQYLHCPPLFCHLSHIHLLTLTLTHHKLVLSVLPATTPISQSPITKISATVVPLCTHKTLSVLIFIMNNAFVTPFSAPVQSTASRRVNICSSRPAPTTPFFASTAFGAPVVHRVAPPPVRANVRMDVTIVVGENEPVESGMLQYMRFLCLSIHLRSKRLHQGVECTNYVRVFMFVN